MQTTEKPRKPASAPGKAPARPRTSEKISKQDGASGHRPAENRRPAPAGQAQRQAPAGQAQRQAPAGQAQRQAPAGQAQRQAPAGQAQRQAPAGQAQRQAPAGQAQRQAPAGQARRPAPAGQAQGAPAKKAAGTPKSARRPESKGGLLSLLRPAKSPKQTKRAKPAKSAPATDLSEGRKRAYGNSKPKKPSTISRMGKAVSGAVEKQKTRRESKSRSRPNLPAVIYTEPKAFSRNRLLVQLLTMWAVVMALVMGLSVFFKVENITVAGANVYTPYRVLENSGIKPGDNLLTFSRPRAGAQIKANLPYVKTVRFGIKLPDTVNIIIEEEDVVYAIKDTTGAWWLVSSKGRVVEQAKGGKASNYTQLLGFTLENPSPDTQAVAHEAVMETLPEGSTEGAEIMGVLTTTNAQRMQVALEIMSSLEDNDIIGTAASVDVSNLEDIILWYGTRYQVNLGDSSNIPYKITCMNDVILQLSEYQSGILDISFTIWPNQVGYTPFG